MLDMDIETINSILIALAAVFSALFSLSEALAGIPKIKANSVFQAVYHILGRLSGNIRRNKHSKEGK
jgi:hypothetical protein